MPSPPHTQPPTRRDKHTDSSPPSYPPTDSSNEDWGFRFTATAYYTATATYEDAHWLLLLERHLNACIAALVGGLVASVPWQGELEARNRRWVEGPDAILGDGCQPRQEGATAAETSLQSSFLSSLITRPPGSPAAALVAAMRGLVAEDRGRHPSVDRAVYAGVAALLHHNGLVGEAMALAERAAAGECDGGGGGALEGAIASPSLLRAWRAGAKMRHFFAFADVRAGLQGPSEQQQQQPPPPSLYGGAEDAVVDAAAAEVVERAQFLITLAPAASFSPSRRARVRSQHQAPAAAPAPAPGGAGDKEGQWAAVVQELHASSPSIMEVFAQRREEAQREQLARLCSTTERVLRFLQVGWFVHSTPISNNPVFHHHAHSLPLYPPRPEPHPTDARPRGGGQGPVQDTHRARPLPRAGAGASDGAAGADAGPAHAGGPAGGLHAGPPEGKRGRSAEKRATAGRRHDNELTSRSFVTTNQTRRCHRRSRTVVRPASAP